MTTIRESNISDNLDLTGKNITLPIEIEGVVHYESRQSFPELGRSRRIYIAEDTGSAWTWTGTSYRPTSPSLDEFASLEGTLAEVESALSALESEIDSGTY